MLASAGGHHQNVCGRSSLWFADLKSSVLAKSRTMMRLYGPSAVDALRRSGAGRCVDSVTQGDEGYLGEEEGSASTERYELDGL